MGTWGRGGGTAAQREGGGTQGGEMGTQREGYRDPEGAGTRREGDRDPERREQKLGEGEPGTQSGETGSHPPRPRQGELRPRDRTWASDLEQGRSPACRWCW